MTGIEIAMRDSGTIVVQRFICGVVVDRYNTHDLKQPIKRNTQWIRNTTTLCSQPSANINIAVPPIPEVQPTKENKLLGIINKAFVAMQEMEVEKRAGETIQENRIVPFSLEEAHRRAGQTIMIRNDVPKEAEQRFADGLAKLAKVEQL